MVIAARNLQHKLLVNHTIMPCLDDRLISYLLLILAHVLGKEQNLLVAKDKANSDSHIKAVQDTEVVQDTKVVQDTEVALGITAGSLVIEDIPY